MISFVVLSHGPPEKDQQFQYVPSIRNVDALERSIIGAFTCVLFFVCSLGTFSNFEMLILVDVAIMTNSIFFENENEKEKKKSSLLA